MKEIETLELYYKVMLFTCEKNRDTDRNPKVRDQRKNRLESDLQVEVTGRNTEKERN